MCVHDSSTSALCLLSGPLVHARQPQCVPENLLPLVFCACVCVSLCSCLRACTSVCVFVDKKERGKADEWGSNQFPPDRLNTVPHNCLPIKKTELSEREKETQKQKLLQRGSLFSIWLHNKLLINNVCGQMVGRHAMVKKTMVLQADWKD